ncbi:EAL domain-containing protein [Martelella alba]|uniref:EAL domain-containing protein n=1 Tax=Martelella alba TaxID=2590451 RepID=A0A506UFC4_9HYPH|nr:EAL domain-containing protein [Martelella alba]TPW31734.1 EAL domain-containing protein [Martelella alba]
MIRSIENRFRNFVSIVLAVVLLLLLGGLTIISMQRAREQAETGLASLAEMNALALAKPVWDFDRSSVNTIAQRIIIEPDIARVVIADKTGAIAISMNEPGLSDQAALRLPSLTRPIAYKTLSTYEEIGALKLFFHRPGLLSGFSHTELLTLSIFVLGILMLFAASIAIHRHLIIRPLRSLTDAMETTRRLGYRQRVTPHSNDEFAKIARSFNEMQDKLEQEEQLLQQAHRRASDLYNLTPAMQFSSTMTGVISAVSDYWLVATGYRRNAVIGRPFAELVVEADRDIYRRRLTNHRIGEPAQNTTLRLLKANGDILDVLIVETAVSTINGGVEMLSVMTDITELRRSEARIEHQAVTDYLTGLLNRVGFEEALDYAISDADHTTRLACLYIDLDRFKSINDSHGHSAGDELLRAFCARLEPIFARARLAARLGGDEFAIVIAGKDVIDDARRTAAQILSACDEDFAAGDIMVSTSVSIGIALYPNDALTRRELLRRADLAMYQQKRLGRDGVSFFHPNMLQRARERAMIEVDIADGLANGWFEPFFQPIIALATGRIIGFEALMRLRHPQKGILSPGNFVEVAEETLLIDDIGRQILEKALTRFPLIAAKLPPGQCRIAVNFSPLQLTAETADFVSEKLEESGVAPEMLTIEITEAVFLEDHPSVRSALEQLRSSGCIIALDDFGTGFSSLSYLNRFHVDVIKIDKSFTTASTDPDPLISARSQRLIEGIAAISQKMECHMIAEGVETAEQAALVHRIGIQSAQGFLYARPMSLADTLAFLEREAPGGILKSH